MEVPISSIPFSFVSRLPDAKIADLNLLGKIECAPCVCGEDGNCASLLHLTCLMQEESLSIFIFPIIFIRVMIQSTDDTIYHMSYSIPEVDNEKPKAKFTAGRIIPAIATLTAMATGLAFLELYKVLDGGHKLEDYRNIFICQLSAASLFNG